MEGIKGYKVFNPDWTCRDFKYEVGNTYEEDVNPSVCERGFHFCKLPKDCFNYYPFDSDNKVAEVVGLGEVSEEDDKCATNKIKIIREISWQEVLTLVNTGKDCTGHFNSGNYNSGDYNSGHSNSGDYNSGHYNSGGSNSGYWNSGHWNSGNRNSGHYNSGDYNSGHSNSGHWNSGNRNSGSWNSGDYNSGDWNEASETIGCFNTQNQKLRFFDKETDMTFEEWRNSDAYWLLTEIDFRPTDWICSDEMTGEEKTEHPEHKTTGGYLKIRDNTDCCVEWWNRLSDYDKNIIKNIPNFDAEKFYYITGIKAQNEEANNDSGLSDELVKYRR